jgi:hypothetical protein
MEEKRDTDVPKIIDSINDSLFKVTNFKKGIEYYIDEDGYREYYEVPVDLYLNLFSQVLRYDITMYEDQYVSEYTYPLAKYLGINCAEKLGLYNVYPSVAELEIDGKICYLNNTKIAFLDWKNRYIEKSMKKISEMILKILGKESFLICYIKLNHAHANAMFVEKNGNSLYLSWYEPHGSGISGKRYEFSNNFLQSLAKYSDYDIKYKTNVGPDRGVQEVTWKNDIGYCLTFSFYWLYCCLSIALYKKYIKKSKENSFNWIWDVENYITKNKNPYVIAVSFCNFMFDIFMTNTKLDKLEILFKMQNLFNSSIADFKFIKEVKSEEEKGYKKKERESWEKIPISETMEYEEYKSKKECSSNLDCSSDCCKDGFCVLGKECGKGQEKVLMYDE